jgi:hypothetical protein
MMSLGRTFQMIRTVTHCSVHHHLLEGTTQLNFNYMQTSRRKHPVEIKEEEMLVNSEELFSPLADIDCRIPSTPSWSAPDSVLNTIDSIGHDNSPSPSTPMTPTHELYKDNLFSTRSEYSFSDLSHFQTSGRKVHTLLTTPSSTTATSPSSMQTPQSARHHPLSAFSLFRQEWNSKSQRKPLAQYPTVFMSQTIPLQARFFLPSSIFSILV